MKVVLSFDDFTCDNCEAYSDERYTIYNKEGHIIIKLCKKCLLELLDAIIKR